MTNNTPFQGLNNPDSSESKFETLLFSHICESIQTYANFIGWSVDDVLAVIAENKLDGEVQPSDALATGGVLVNDEPKLATSFSVKKVDVERGPFWTVIKYIHSYGESGSSVLTEGGDHHWLAPAAAYAAKQVYEVCNIYHGKSPAFVMEAFGNYFPDQEWPIIEVQY